MVIKTETQSFCEGPVITTGEQGQAILKAFDDADMRSYPHHLPEEAGEAPERGNRTAEEGYFDKLPGRVTG